MMAVILAGGLGKRLRPLTDKMPKSMVPIAGKPIVEHQIDWLKGAGVQEVVLCVGHLSNQLIEYFGTGSGFGVRVSYAIEEEPLGTAGALKHALTLNPPSQPFFSLNGDVLTSADPLVALRALEDSGAAAVLTLAPLPSPYGEVVTDNNGRVQAFTEKPRLFDHWINAGVYCLDPSIEPTLPTKGSLEFDVFPILAQEEKLFSVKHADGFWLSVDSPKDVEEATKIVSS